MAFTGDKRTGVRDASSSPEYSTNGNLRKCWLRYVMEGKDARQIECLNV